MATDNNYNEIMENTDEHINEIEVENSILTDGKVKTEELKKMISSVEKLISDSQSKLGFDDIKEKLENISLQVEGCNNTLTKDFYDDINELKNLTNKVGKNIEDLQNAQNAVLTSNEFEEFQKQQLDLALKTNENIFDEFEKIKDSAKNLAENLEVLKELKTSFGEENEASKEQIEAVVNASSKILEELQSIKQCCASFEDGIGILNEIKDTLTGESEFEKTMRDKLDEIINSDEALVAALEDIKETSQNSDKFAEAVEELQKTMLTDSKFEEYTKQQLDFALKTNENIFNEIDKLKETSQNINNHIENLQNIQNLALTSAEFSEFQKQQLDLALKTNENIFNELNDLKEASKSANAENIENIDNLKIQLDNLHTNLKSYIEKIIAKADASPTLDDIGGVVSDLNSVQQKSIKQTNSLIKDLQANFENFEKDFKNKDFETQITKISEIYDSLNIINAWIEKVGYVNQSIENVYARLGESIDFDDVAEKVDIIYENISALNNWTSKVDNIDTSVVDVQSKLASLSVCIENTRNIANTLNTVKEFLDTTFSPDVDFEDIANKMDIVYENLSSINEWASKVDTVSENINQLNEKVSTIDEAFSEDMITSKIDLIYENIGLLNEWVSKIDDIAQKSEELDSKYTQANDSLNIKIDEIAETLSNASKIIEDVPNLKDKLEELSGELHAITCSTKNDTESYIYTLLDIESDFLKLHKFLDDSTKITSQDINSLKECFTELTDDISSISIRTNKLILSADDANKQFKTYLDEFKNAINVLESRQRKYNFEQKHLILESKLNNLIMLMQKSITASKNLNTAFAYLAEWVDATGSVINSVQNDINVLKTGDYNGARAPYATFEDTKVIVESLNFLNENVAGINRNMSIVQQDVDGLMSLKETVNSILPAVQQGASQEEIKPAIDNIEQNMSDIKELNSVMVEMVLEVKNNTLQVQEFKDTVSELSKKTSELEEAFSAFKTEDTSELKSMITGVMVQLNTALTPDIDSLNERIEKVSEENGNKFTELETLMKEKIELQSKKIETLEEKIENLSGKFDKLIDVMGETNSNYEIKDVLNYIAAQIAATNESVNNKVASEEAVKAVESKLASFDSNINKIVSYIEEE